MQALYEGRCDKCTHPILVGQDIVGKPKKWVHRRCPGVVVQEEEVVQPSIDPGLLEELQGFIAMKDPVLGALNSARLMSTHSALLQDVLEKERSAG